jgi:predicted O-methyltransferase YrrM
MLVAQDVDLIRELVRRLREQEPRRVLQVVDIGAGSGTTALSVFAEASDRVLVRTVDHNAQALAYSKLVVSNIGRLRDWRGFVGDSARAIFERGGQDIDLLLVDAEHTYKAVMADLAAWLPLLRDSGFVWVHDYGDPMLYGLGVKPSRGVKRAINELVRKHELTAIEIVGLGWAGQRYVEQEERDEDLGPRRKRTTW